MQRYHDPSQDPQPLRSPDHDAERARIEQATQAYLARGGRIEQIGAQMRETPQPFVINPERSPVYAHLFQAPPAEPQDADDERDARLAGQVLAEAAQDHGPARIARRLGLTEKQVRQLARDYHITFHKQR